MEKAREQIADLLGADSKEIIFTSGATESNNISVKGVARFYKGKKNHVITTQTEHKCVLDSCRQLEAEGFEVTYLPVQQNGRIDMEEFKSVLRPTTSLVSVMMVNNEIGVVQPVAEIGQLCRKNKTFFSHGRRSGRRQNPRRRQRHDHRPHVHLRTQGVRAQGSRRALCPKATEGESGAHPVWRRTGEGTQIRHR